MLNLFRKCILICAVTCLHAGCKRLTNKYSPMNTDVLRDKNTDTQDEIRSTSLQHVSIYKDSSDGAESPVRRAGRRVGEIHSLTMCVRVCQCVWLSSDLGQGTITWIKGGGRVMTTDVTDVKGNEEQPINRLLLLNNKPLVKNLGLELKKKSLKT